MMGRTQGFTLLELTIVIIIMAILAAVAAFNLPSTATMQNQSTADTLRSDLTLTKILAMSMNQRYKITIRSSSYQILDQNSRPINHPENGFDSTTYPDGTSIAPVVTLTFDSMGQPYIGSTPITSPINFMVTTNTSLETISVSPQTGFIQ